MPPKVLLAARLRDGPVHTATVAARLAGQIGGELVLLYVAPELSTVPQLHAATGDDPDDLRERILAEIEASLREFVAANRLEGRVRTRVLEGEVVEAITAAATEEAADYLVIGTDARSAFSKLVLGSTSEGLLKRATVPVVVVPPPA